MTPINDTVAIVGRPNVGKSALFNRLAARRISIVHDQPGVTRDRLSAECRLGARPFTIVDTGGIGSVVDVSFAEQVRIEADIAIQTAAVIVFVVDGQDGITPVDQELASLLRRVGKPLLLVVNKIDHPKHESFEDEFTAFGFECIHAISAEHGRGIGDLVADIEARLPEPAAAEPGATPELPLRLAIVGRPNVGKSSLINAIVSDSRTMVSAISGTTRDAVDIPYTRGDREFLLIDTAGIRPRGKQSNSVEVFSVMRSERSIRRADLCILVIDALEGVTAQDKKIASLIQESSKPCLVAINKWDLAHPAGAEKEDTKSAIERVRAELFFLDYAPVIPVSAKTGEHMRRLFRFIDLVCQHAATRITTGPLNRLLQKVLSDHAPPMKSGKRFKLLYGTQIEPKPDERLPVPRLMLFVNDPKALTPPYRKYVESQIRQTHPFTGLPIIFQFKGREPRRTRSR